MTSTEEMLAQLRADEKEAAALYAAAQKLKAEKVAAGVNLVTDEGAFEEVNKAFEAHGLAAQKVQVTKDRIEKLQGFEIAPAGMSGGRTLKLFPEPGEAFGGLDTLFPLAARFTESAQFKTIAKMAGEMGDAQFIAAIMDGGSKLGHVPVLSRAELGATLWGPGRYGATAITGGSATSAGPFIINDLQPGFVDYRRKAVTLANVVGRGETNSDVVEYVSQSAPTNAAAATAETNNAAESTYPFATNTVNVQEIVHFVPITRRAMQDDGQIRTIIEQDLITDLLDKLEDQMATGLGTGDELEGIYTAVTQSQSASGIDRPEALLRAITKIRIAAGVLDEPDYIGIHPTDYQAVLLSQDAEGGYLMGPPSMPGSRSCWGVPFLVSTVFTAGTPLVGNYARGARLWLRSGAEILAGLNASDFVQRRMSLMATMRVAFKTIRPTAFTEVTSF